MRIEGTHRLADKTIIVTADITQGIGNFPHHQGRLSRAENVEATGYPHHGDRALARL